MKLKHCLILLTLVSVMADTMLLPFYPQFFAVAFNMHSPEHVGFYIAACCLTIMTAFPLWAKLAKHFNEIHIWIYTQIIAGALGVYCYFTSDLVAFWIASLVMLIFKASYLLIYPFVMRLEEKDHQLGMVGLFSVLMHFGGIGGAVLGGLTLQWFDAKSIYLIMAASDALQVLVCLYLVSKLNIPLRVKATEITASEEANKTITGGQHFMLKLGIITALFYFSAFLIQPFFASYWQIISQWDSEFISALVYAIPAGVALLCLLLSYKYPSNQSNVQIIIRALCIGMLGLFLQGSQETWMVIVGRCLFGYSLYQVSVRLEVFLFNVSEPENYGRDYSKIHIFQNVGIIFASFASGYLATTLDANIPFLLAVGGFLITLSLFYWLFKPKVSTPKLFEQESEQASGPQPVSDV